MRFVWGFGILAVWIGLLNFGMAIVTMVTVKGVYIPLWAIPAVAIGVLVFCTLIGHYFEKWDIWNRMTSHGNKAANPEISEILTNTSESKAMLNDIKSLLEPPK